MAIKTYVGRGAGDFLERELFSAEKYLLICSPYIDSIYAVKAKNLAGKNVQVYILTSDDKSEKEQKEALGELREATKGPRLLGRKDYVPLPLGFRIIDKNHIHPRIYCVDGRYACVGSMDMNRQGLWEDVEHMVIFDSPDDVKKVEEDFEHIWKSYDNKDVKEETPPSRVEEFLKVLREKESRENLRE